MDPFLTTLKINKFIYFFILESTKEHCTLPQIHTTDRHVPILGDGCVSSLIMKRFRSGTHRFKPTWWTATIHKDEHTHAHLQSWEQWQTEWAQTPNSVFHLSFCTSGCKIHHYYVAFPVKADPSECKLVWGAIHMPWVYREMEHGVRAKTDEVYVVSVHLSDLQQGYLWEHKIIRG